MSLQQQLVECWLRFVFKEAFNTYQMSNNVMRLHLGNSRSVFLLLLLISVALSASNFGVATALGETVKPLVEVVVDSAVYDLIETSLDRYLADVESTGFSANVILTSQLLDNSAHGLRSFLQGSQNRGLVGAVLVGDVAEAWFEVGDHLFPTDVYYMDLDGAWFDSDNDGIYDGRGGDLLPEIWVGRLKASTISRCESSVFNDYFRKNHLYRTGSLTVPWWRSLIYIDDQGLPGKQEAENSLGYVTTDRTCITYPMVTNASDYKSFLSVAEGYHWLYVMSHGDASNHSFYAWAKQNSTIESEGTIYSADYREIDPRIFFYWFFTCSAGRYTSQDYLGGSVVLSTSWGLAALGSTDDTYSFSTDDFFKSLSEGKSLGEAFKHWLSSLMQKNIGQYVLEPRYQILFNAMSLIGDPTLVPIIETHDVAVTNLDITFENSSGAESLSIRATVENHGKFAEKVRLEILYDSLRVFEADLFLDVEETSNVTFSPLDSFHFIWGKHSSHRIEARASLDVGEFHKGDNSQMSFFEGKIIESPLPFQFPPVIMPVLFNLASAFAAFVIFKQLMSDRPSIAVYLARVREFLRKMRSVST